jgi:WD40 repeat protein/uncharacterized caspase-like protein
VVLTSLTTEHCDIVSTTSNERVVNGMRYFLRVSFLSVLFTLFVLQSHSALTSSLSQDPQAKPEPTPTPNKQDDRGLGVITSAASAKSDQTASSGAGLEIVLQAGISAPQTQISFSPDGRLLASMGIYGNSIKLWEVATGRLLRQLESSIPSMGTTSMTRPFRFSADGKTLIAADDGRVRRWEVDTGRELPGVVLPSGKNVISALLSDDGRTLAARNITNQTVKLWDTSTGRELRSLTFDENENLAEDAPLALSPDGKLLAVFTVTTKMPGKNFSKGLEKEPRVTLWDVVTGHTVQTMKLPTRTVPFGGGTNEIASLAFTPDGQWLALRDEAAMKIWEVASGREVKTFATPRVDNNPSDGMQMFASRFLFSSDHRLVSVVNEGNKINILDGSSGSMLQALAGHQGKVVGLSFSADGKLFASSGVDNQITIWDVASGRAMRTFRGAALPITDIAFSADGKTLVLAGPQAVSSWELNTGGVRRGIALPDEFAEGREGSLMGRNAALSPDGKYLVAGNKAGAVAKIWEVASGRELPNVTFLPGKQFANAAFTADGHTLALVDKNISKRGSPTSPGPAAQTGAPANPPPTNGTPDLSKMPGMPNLGAMPDMSKIMEQMKKDPKKMQEQIKKAQDAMAKGDLSAGMDLMASMGIVTPKAGANRNPNSLRFFDVASGKEQQSIPLAGNFISDIASDSPISSSALSYSPDGRTLASASGMSGPIVLREASSGQELRTLKSPFAVSVNSLAWSPDGKRLASGQWSMNSNLMTQDAPDFSFEDMKFSIKIWDPQTGTELNSLTGHNNLINVLSFSSDGQMLASGGYDSTIKLWDVNTGRELRTLKGHSGSITALRFSPDGQFVISGSDDGSARLWNAESGELLATLVSLNKGNDWLVVTPAGLFDGSPGGWNQIMWRFTPNLFDVSSVEIFFNEYFRPGLLPDIMAGKKLSAAVDISRKDRRQPKLALERSEGAGSEVSSRAAKVRVKITEALAGAQDVRLFRNGSLVKVWRGDVLQGQPNATLETTVNIVAGENEFTAYAFNRDNVKSADATLSLTGAASLKRQATLHLLVIGVNSYENSAYDLKYAAADARAFGAEVESQQRKLGRYQQIEVTSLLDQDATKANVLYALGRLGGVSDLKTPAGLSPELTKSLQAIKGAEPEDAVVLYYAGHGTAQGQRFYLIPHDLGFAGKRTELDQAGLQSILSHSISDLELEQSFAELDAGLTLMVIDACNSGQALEAEEKRRGPMNSKGLAQLAYEKGMYIMTAAQSYQAALEAAQLGHGYLTFALVEEGLKTAAADTEPRDNQVTLREWLDYATERVPRMQEEKMRATRGIGTGNGGVGVAFVEGEEQIKEVEKRSVQRPRVFYRREPEAQPLIVARP